MTSRKLLEEFVDIDVNTDSVSRIVQRNQYVEHLLLHEIQTLRMKESTPTLKAAIALLGMARVRDFVNALQMVRMVGKRHPKIGKDGRYDFKPTEMLKYALRTEEFMNIRRMQYADTGYAAGMMFDLMVKIGQEFFQAPKAFSEYVDEVYKHSLRSAMVGVELAKTVKNLGFAKFVFSACLLHDIGKLAMELMFPPGAPNSFQSFRAEVAKKQLSREMIHFVESARFGLTHEYYGSQMAYFFHFFRGIEKAILFHHDPYLIRTSNRELYTLSALMALASNVASHLKPPKDQNDPLYKAWFPPELRDFKLEHKIMKIVVSRVMSERMY
jgi:HD-like signal output (HDOD) protein